MREKRNFKGELSVIIMQYYYLFLFFLFFLFSFFFLIMCIYHLFWLNYSMSFLHCSRTSLKQKRRSLLTMCPVELYMCVCAQALHLFFLSGVVFCFLFFFFDYYVFTLKGVFFFFKANHLSFYINRVPACSSCL